MEEKTDIFGAINTQKAMLEKTGVWPHRSKTKGYKTRQVISWIFDLTLSGMLLLELKLNISERDYKKMTDLFSFMATDISYVTKHIIYLKNSSNFMDMIDKLKDPLFKKYPMACNKHVVTATKYARILMRIYQFFALNLVIIYSLRPWFSEYNTAIRFEYFNLGKLRVPVHLVQVVAIGNGVWNNTTLDVLAFGLISIASAQFQILCDKLINIRQWSQFSYEEIGMGVIGGSVNVDVVKNDAKINARIKECVQHHHAILKFTENLEEIYCYYFLIQFATSVLGICNTWFQFMMTDDVINIIFLAVYSVSLMFQLLIYCSYGNNVTVKSEEVRDACYQSDWYYCSNAAKKSLMIIMERAKRPTYLTAGNLSILGLATFSSLMQSSYSYFALMQHLYGN